MNADSFIKCDLSNFFKNSKYINIIMFFLLEIKIINQIKIYLILICKKIPYINFKGNLMNAGIYYFKNNIIKGIPKKNISLENNIIYKLIKKKLIKGKKLIQILLILEHIKIMRLVKKIFIKNFFHLQLFWIEERVINYDYGYVSKMKHFRLRKNVIKGLKLLNKKNYNIFIVTNQSGIARGYFTEENFLNFYKSIKEYFF